TLAVMFPQLDNPPVTEVACGFVFNPLDLDALSLGSLAASLNPRIPKARALTPLIEAGPRVLELEGPPPVRAALFSADESLVLQAQNDRFFVNWRKTTADYPSFSGRNGGVGVLSYTLQEFEAFKSYFGVDPKLRRREILKVDECGESVHTLGSDRKSTRLNSSHVKISYAVFCLKKK